MTILCWKLCNDSVSPGVKAFLWWLIRSCAIWLSLKNVLRGKYTFSSSFFLLLSSSLCYTSFSSSFYFIFNMLHNTSSRTRWNSVLGSVHVIKPEFSLWPNNFLHNHESKRCGLILFFFFFFLNMKVGFILTL